ncbi:flavin reductase family protein [Saccharothrix variisporea]|uniref:Flavin reductase (DIM6/NTAB) family NADH-FMN oxidoreductase RutF n=1 Tax=Saccharothrix variisporea TaxID=543527 RepID=A0A495X6T4_9PSEU|nr:flavin reductase family protein [Saccharothrix variisporea]RKT68845.1 flavin reductase (DIM6/NTAB) family NADH-FMN oxidoreductase RutF [Saccharothrix variisporea]
MTAVLPSSAFRAAFRRHPAGVVVITTDSEHGPVGFTATSLTSVSAEPPLVSFGISTTSSSWPHVREAHSVVVHFLGAHQEELARRFATSGLDRFATPTRWRRLAGGEPVLDDVAGWLRAEVESLIPVGDHHLVLARVVDTVLHEDTGPLLYHDGRYHTI